MTDAEKLKAAVDTVARHMVKKAADFAIGFSVDWGDYPDLCDADYASVVARAKALVNSIAPTDAAYTAAYAHLTERVGDTNA